MRQRSQQGRGGAARDAQPRLPSEESGRVTRHSMKAKNPEGTASEALPRSEAEMAADAVRAARKAKREAKAAAAAAKRAVTKPGMGRQEHGGKNALGIAASASKATAVSRSIISRARGGRGR